MYAKILVYSTITHLHWTMCKIINNIYAKILVYYTFTKLHWTICKIKIHFMLKYWYMSQLQNSIGLYVK